MDAHAQGGRRLTLTLRLRRLITYEDSTRLAPIQLYSNKRQSGITLTCHAEGRSPTLKHLHVGTKDPSTAQKRGFTCTCGTGAGRVTFLIDFF